ncbi:MAG: hypothetical protein R6V85_06545 [Polyangia bacterium]
MTFETSELDYRGVPFLKALWQKGGVTIDCAAARNRHLRVDHLDGYELNVELIEVPLDPELYEEDFDEEEIDLLGMTDEEEEELLDEEEERIIREEDECPDYPHGCEECEEYGCTGPDDEPDPEHATMPELVARIRKKGSKRWKALGETDPFLEKHPALCRFLTQIEDTHGV